ncbi:MAG TPA: hypothetical protein VFB43_17940 [Terracidiphilus sp.]|nr:hypothetical protein [Terracidiphilus sp.]
MTDPTGTTDELRSVDQRIADLEHDNNLLRAAFAEVITSNFLLRKSFEEMTERNIKLVKRVNEFLDRWTVA